jgi:hypothetical protein
MVFQTPWLRSAGLDEKVQATAVGQLEGPLPALGIFDLEFLQSHLGVSPASRTGEKYPKKYPQFKSTWRNRAGFSGTAPIAIGCRKYLILFGKNTLPDVAG